MAPTNTKTIARLTGLTTAQVNATARDLGIAMTYHWENHHWTITNPRVAVAFVEHLQEVAA